MRKNPKTKVAKKVAKKTALQKHLAEVGAKGGKATLKRYGKEHYTNLANARWSKKK